MKQVNKRVQNLLGNLLEMVDDYSLEEYRIKLFYSVEEELNEEELHIAILRGLKESFGADFEELENRVDQLKSAFEDGEIVVTKGYIHTNHYLATMFDKALAPLGLNIIVTDK